MSIVIVVLRDPGIAFFMKHLTSPDELLLLEVKLRKPSMDAIHPQNNSSPPSAPILTTGYHGVAVFAGAQTVSLTW
jgi:hypothetical protein